MRVSLVDIESPAFPTPTLTAKRNNKRGVLMPLSVNKSMQDLTHISNPNETIGTDGLSFNPSIKGWNHPRPRIPSAVKIKHEENKRKRVLVKRDAT
jgi:hypothetical protein